ncbi:MAG TPA: hypothetical protein EYH09_00125 [Candidatus Nanopusillus sp.]|nr:hypothetical protein [Candidatus Nanopusillus sp.]
MEIRSAKARIVLNSRGDPTIEVEINGVSESAPQGASIGKYEAMYVDPMLAVNRFNEDLSKVLTTFDIQSLDDLKEFEECFFNIGGFRKYGANTLIATEYAILRAWSKYTGAPIYVFFNKNPKINIRPLSNVIGGGAHALWRGPDIQEFLVLPETKYVKLGIFINSLVHKLLGEKLSINDKGFLGAKNDEGAWVSTLDTDIILTLISNVIDEVREQEGVDVRIGMDVAASQLYINGYYIYKRESKKLSREEQIDKMLKLIEDFDLYYIEDPLHEEDFEGFSEINSMTDALITGDDLTVTNPKRINEAIKSKSVKAVIIKPNQVGSIVKTTEAVALCKKNNIIPILSHRSGETESNILSHLAVGLEIPIVKFGIVNGERTAKLNELIRIEEKLL